jgi:hypothetical protein
MLSNIISKMINKICELKLKTVKKLEFVFYFSISGIEPIATFNYGELLCQLKFYQQLKEVITTLSERHSSFKEE